MWLKDLASESPKVLVAKVKIPGSTQISWIQVSGAGHRNLRFSHILKDRGSPGVVPGPPAAAQLENLLEIQILRFLILGLTPDVLN